MFIQKYVQIGILRDDESPLVHLLGLFRKLYVCWKLCSNSDFRIPLDLAISLGKLYGIPLILRYFGEWFSSKNTSKSVFDKMTRAHLCTS